jgi:N-methylhydantoinase B/oxoprolinase/acetone carboxylase alpha subunit
MTPEEYYPIPPTKTQKAIICIPKEVQVWKNENQTLKTRIAELEIQVAALKKIAIKEVAQMLIADGAEMCIVPHSVYSEADCYCVEDVMQCPARDYVLSEAYRQLAEEHPEAFR